MGEADSKPLVVVARSIGKIRGRVIDVGQTGVVANGIPQRSERRPVVLRHPGARQGQVAQLSAVICRRSRVELGPVAGNAGVPSRRGPVVDADEIVARHEVQDGDADAEDVGFLGELPVRLVAVVPADVHVIHLLRRLESLRPPVAILAGPVWVVVWCFYGHAPVS